MVVLNISPFPVWRFIHTLTSTPPCLTVAMGRAEREDCSESRSSERAAACQCAIENSFCLVDWRGNYNDAHTTSK